MLGKMRTLFSNYPEVDLFLKRWFIYLWVLCVPSNNRERTMNEFCPDDILTNLWKSVESLSFCLFCNCCYICNVCAMAFCRKYGRTY